MEKIALITDTAADLHEDIIKKYNIEILPFRIIYSDREYKDKLEITPQEVYDNFKIEVPTSSLPSMQDTEDVLSKLEKEGYTHAIIITLSSGLSGIYNSVKLVSENHPNLNIHVYDSHSISMGEGILVQKCGEMIAKGMSFDDITNEIPRIRNKVHLFFVVGTLEYLKRGGRIGKVSGTIAELLNIKPIIGVDKNDGKYYTYDKVRGRKQSLNRLLELAKEILDKTKCKLYIVHGDALEESKKVYDVISTHENVVEGFFGGQISPVAGVHSGPGLVGLILIEE
ncbi:DegV family protein [Clostridium peptidivorans]|uniref:DegV family protein n=1 Tax=Clostridium peptidivorans TaxID=100174 RepID=UPI000BE3B2D3|nr:DegV family protein [Clostridium peptidivorans]